MSPAARRLSAAEYLRFYERVCRKVIYHGGDHATAIPPCHPDDGDDHAALTIHLNTGWCTCHSGCGGQSYSPQSLIARLEGIADFGEQTRRLYELVDKPVTGNLRDPLRAWDLPFPLPRRLAGGLELKGFSILHLLDAIHRLQEQTKATASHLFLYRQHVKLRLRDARGSKHLFQLALTRHGGWSTPRKAGVTAELYREDALNGARQIFLLNGEKAVDRAVAAWGIHATCLPNGEGNWRSEYLSPLMAAERVFVPADNDTKGRDAARHVAQQLANAGLAACLVELPGLPEKGDVYDFIEGGGTLDDFLAICHAAPPLAAQTYAATALNGGGPRTQAGEEPPPETPPPPPSPPSPPPPGSSEPDLLHFLPNHEGNAERIQILYPQQLHFAAEWKKWLTWHSTHWHPDDIAGRAELMATETMRTLLRQANAIGDEVRAKAAIKWMNPEHTSAMLHKLRPLAALDVNELDQHPDLLNFRNGTVDLRTGKPRPHRRQDYITKLVDCDYDPEARCPAWIKFLGEIMGASPDSGESELERAGELLDYLRLVLGYAVTGHTREKAIFLLVGPKDTGKTTLLNTLAAILPDYTAHLLTETLMARRKDIDTHMDLAGLFAKRIAITSETERRQSFDQSTLKRLTQGTGKIRARYMYASFFEFAETHKLFVDTNSAPRLRDTDDLALLERLHVIPCRTVFSGERKDPQLAAKLFAERAGILAWLVAAAGDWYRQGLDKPPAVAAAGEEYRAANDPFAEFFEDRCVWGDSFRVKGGQLYKAYCDFAEGNGEEPASHRLLTQTLLARGIKQVNQGHGQGRFYVGVALRFEDGDPHFNDR